MQPGQDRSTGISYRGQGTGEVDTNQRHVQTQGDSDDSSTEQPQTAHNRSLQKNHAADLSRAHPHRHQHPKLPGPFHNRHKECIENSQPRCNIKNRDNNHP